MKTDTLYSSSRDVGLSGFHVVGAGIDAESSSSLFEYSKLRQRKRKRKILCGFLMVTRACVRAPARLRTCISFYSLSLFIFVLCELNFLVVVDLLLHQSKNAILPFCI